MKEIDPYLHLYLGCMCYKKLSTVINKNPQILTTRLYEWATYSMKCQTVILILRPLSDMTEEEKDEKLTAWNNHRYGNGTCNYAGIPYNETIAYADQTRYLLSKHFDLFGLIEAGLAIDKTTLK